MAMVEARVDRLEDVLQEFITNVGNSQLRTEAELRAFKDEMRLFREDTQAFKDEMRLFREDTQAFKDEMRAFKEEGREQNREMNRRWGELANKLGTLVEDLVAPSLPRIISEVLNQEVIDFHGCDFSPPL